MTRRTWLLGLATVACGRFAGGCERQEAPTAPTGPPTGPPEAPPPPCRAPAPIGYAAVQAWRTEAPDRLAERLAEAGATLSQAELGPEGVPPALGAWVRALRRRGIAAWIVGANWNDPRWASIDDDAWRSHLRAILATRPDWLEPVSEPEGPRAVALQRLALAEAGADSVQWIIPWGFDAAGYPAGSLRDIHYCRLADLETALDAARPDVVHTMDCTSLLASRLPADVLTRLAARAAARRARLLLYDTFGAATSAAVLAALRRGLCP